MGKRGERLWALIEGPEGEAYISDAVVESDDEQVLREAEVRLEAARRVVRLLSAFIKRERGACCHSEGKL